MNRSIKVKLVALRTKDGFWLVKVDKATIGKVYEADPSTRRMATMFNIPSQTEFRCEIIDVWDEDANAPLHFPTELLEFQ